MYLFRWLYLANKKQERAENKENETTFADKAHKTGVENKAFEAEENNIKMKNKENTIQATSDLDKDNVKQSQIEMGFTESMVCSNKL